MPNMDKNDNIINLRNKLEQRINNVESNVSSNNIESNVRSNNILFAKDLQSFLEADNRIPFGCNILPYNRLSLDNDEPGFEDIVLVDFYHQDVNLHGRIGLRFPVFPQVGFVHMSCRIDKYNGCFLEITAETSDEMYEVMAFCQSLLQCQHVEIGYYIDYVQIPNNLMYHRFVSHAWRELNLNQLFNNIE